MDYRPQPLTLKLDRLDGLSPQLLTSHHENNYTGAVKRLLAIRRQLGELDWATAPVFVVNGLKREELVAANSAVLHELYFECLGGDGVLPTSGMQMALERDFGSVQRWRSEFCALAKAMGGGSGWAILAWSSREGRLIHHWASDHTQLLAGATPVLALDMYEHAYHMDFGAKAASYVDAFMKNILWQAVHRRYAAAVAGDAVALEARATTQDLGTAQVIDVRHTQDFAAAADMLPGAVWNDPARVAEWSAQLDTAQPVLVYCVKGLDIGRSTALALRARGFEVRFVAGGIEGWRRAGLPLQAKDKR